MRASLPLLTLVRLQFTTFLGSSKVEPPPLAILKVQRRIVTLDDSTGTSLDYCSGDRARFGEVPLSGMNRTGEPYLLTSTLPFCRRPGDFTVSTTDGLPLGPQEEGNLTATFGPLALRAKQTE